jgi:hypothetical protein
MLFIIQFAIDYRRVCGVLVCSPTASVTEFRVAIIYRVSI